MNSEKLQFWFVNDELPRVNDYTNKLEFIDAGGLRYGLARKWGTSDFRAYLGNYEIGKIWWANGGFVIDITKEFGKGIFAIVGYIFDDFIFVENEYMDEVLKNGVSLEDFVITVLKNNNIDAVITDNHYISSALCRGGYISALLLKDAIHVDFKDKIDDESVLLVKAGMFNYDDLPMEEEANINCDDEVWIVSNYMERINDWKYKEKHESAKQLVYTMSMIEKANYDDYRYRLYFGEYEIGILELPEDRNEKHFLLVGSPENALSDSIASRLEHIFGMRVDVSFETMDSLIKQNHTIESFVSMILGEKLDAVITDDSQRIWELLHNGYQVICSLNDILNRNIKCKPNLFFRGGHYEDRRVILVKLNPQDWLSCADELDDE